MQYVWLMYTGSKTIKRQYKNKLLILNILHAYLLNIAYIVIET